MGGRRRRPALRGATALLLALAVLGPSSGIVTAEEEEPGRPISSLLPCNRPVVPPRCVSVGNDSKHYLYIDPSVPSGLAASLRRAMTEVYDSTNLEMIVQARITDRTDAIAYAADYGPNGAAGWTYCPPDSPQGVNARGHRWCRHQEIHFNLNVRYAVFFGDTASTNHIACHELGHTLGLRHWGNPPESEGPVGATCMNADTPNGAIDLHEADRKNINAYYPRPRTPITTCLSKF
jgi:hypothetical protein